MTLPPMAVHTGPRSSPMCLGGGGVSVIQTPHDNYVLYMFCICFVYDMFCMKNHE